MIPEWLPNGDLPPGVHFATWREIGDRLSFNPRRQRLLAGFRQACGALRKAGCRLVYLDGSFVAREEHPGGFDGCWDAKDVEHDALYPVFLDFSRRPAAPKRRDAGALLRTAACEQEQGSDARRRRGFAEGPDPGPHRIGDAVGRPGAGFGGQAATGPALRSDRVRERQLCAHSESGAGARIEDAESGTTDSNGLASFAGSRMNEAVETVLAHAYGFGYRVLSFTAMTSRRSG